MITIIAFIVVTILFINLRDRIRMLEKTVAKLVSVPASVFVPPPVAPGQTVVPKPVVVAAAYQEGSSDRFSEWVKEDWLMKLGALLLLIGFGWLATYAFLNNWIGPAGRIAIGIGAGTCILIIGWWRIKTYVQQGGVFLVVGSTTILLTTFAARMLYDFFTPSSALALMFLSTAFVALASVKYKTHPLALASLILAGIAPLLTNSATVDYVSLFAYLFVVVLGAVWIVVVTERRELTAAALILIGLYSLPHIASAHTQVQADLLMFAYAFSALFFLTNTMGILKSRTRDITADLITASGNGLFLLAWIMSAASKEWQSLIISAWMVVFTIGAFMIFKATNRRKPFYVYAGIGIAMLAAATSAELSGATLTIAFIIESAIISIVSYLFLNDIRVAERLNILLVVPIMLSVSSITSRAWESSVIHKDFFVLLILTLVLFGLGLFFKEPVHESDSTDVKQFNAAILISGSIYAYILLWLSLHAIFTGGEVVAVIIALFIYTVIGLVCYFWVHAGDKSVLRTYGGVILALVVTRLLLVDFWQMELSGRIIMFFSIGVMLISTAFYGRRASSPSEIKSI